MGAAQPRVLFAPAREPRPGTGYAGVEAAGVNKHRLLIQHRWWGVLVLWRFMLGRALIQRQRERLLWAGFQS